MALADKLNFSAKQLVDFAQVFRTARLARGLTQLQVAQRAFRYRKSHCKVSRVERCAMSKVDAHCLELMAEVLDVPHQVLTTVDPRFDSRVAVARAATAEGFYDYPAALIGGRDLVGPVRVYAPA